jgi:hypothetical protein
MDERLQEANAPLLIFTRFELNTTELRFLLLENAWSFIINTLLGIVRFLISLLQKQKAGISFSWLRWLKSQS